MSAPSSFRVHPFLEAPSFSEVIGVGVLQFLLVMAKMRAAGFEKPARPVEFYPLTLHFALKIDEVFGGVADLPGFEGAL